MLLAKQPPNPQHRGIVPKQTQATHSAAQPVLRQEHFRSQCKVRFSAKVSQARELNKQKGEVQRIERGCKRKANTAQKTVLTRQKTDRNLQAVYPAYFPVSAKTKETEVEQTYDKWRNVIQIL